MGHPVLEPSAARDFVHELLVRPGLSQDEVDAFLTERAGAIGSPNLDLRGVARAASDLDAAIGSKKDSALEPVEAGHSVAVHLAISRLPLDALGDVDFWTYLSAKFFWRFVVARQNATVGKMQGHSGSADEGDEESSRVPLERYVIGRDHYQIPLRLHLRAQAVDAASDPTLGADLDLGTDFWRSQILGVRTGAFPAWSRAMVAAQRETKLSVLDQRGPGSRVNRLRANVDPVLHTEAEAAAIVDPLWSAAAARPKAPKAPKKSRGGT
jgi:hypothetical protein